MASWSVLPSPVQVLYFNIELLYVRGRILNHPKMTVLFLLPKWEYQNWSLSISYQFPVLPHTSQRAGTAQHKEFAIGLCSG